MSTSGEERGIDAVGACLARAANTIGRLACHGATANGVDGGERRAAPPTTCVEAPGAGPATAAFTWNGRAADRARFM
jgi:hypothetical protein